MTFIISRLLTHDLHRSRVSDQIPVRCFVPVKPDWIPSVVSGARGNFIVSRFLTDAHGNSLVDPKTKSPLPEKMLPSQIYAWSAVFKYDPEKIDDLLGPMISCSLELSLSEKWGNIFRGARRADGAFSFIQSESGMKTHPHVCLVPDSWKEKKVSSFFGKDYDAEKSVFRKICKVIPSPVPCPAMFSRPDFVGMYTQFLGGNSSIILHNIRRGIAFCPEA